MGVSVIEKVGVEYYADATQFKQTTDDVERRWAEMAERLRDGMTAKVGAAHMAAATGEIPTGTSDPGSGESNNSAKTAALASVGTLAALLKSDKFLSNTNIQNTTKQSTSGQSLELQKESLDIAKGNDLTGRIAEKEDVAKRLAASAQASLDTVREKGSRMVRFLNTVSFGNFYRSGTISSNMYLEMARSTDWAATALGRFRTQNRIGQGALNVLAGGLRLASSGFRSHAESIVNGVGSIRRVLSTLYAGSARTQLFFREVGHWISRTGSIAAGIANPLTGIMRLSFRLAGALGKPFGSLLGLIGRSKAAVESATRANPKVAGEKKSNGGFPKMGFGFGAFAGIAAGATVAGAAMLSSFQAASNFNESINKQAEVFRSANPQATAYVNNLASTYGVSKNVASQAMSSFGAIFDATGGTSGQIEQMSERFVKLALDASSFHNISFEEAAQKLKSGLAGQTDGLAELGVKFDENAVKTQAYRMGLARMGEELSSSAKLQARMALITQGMSNANNDLDKTLDGPANQMRKIQGSFQNASITLGQQLMPAFQEGIGFAGDIVGWLGEKIESNKAKIGEWAGWIKEKITVARTMFANLPLVWESLVIQGKVHFSNIGKIFGYLGTVAYEVGAGIAEDFPGLIKEAFWNVVTIAGNLINNVWNILTSGWDGIISSLKLGFNKLLTWMDNATGGLLSKSGIIEIKPEIELAKDWQKLKSELALVDLGTGTSTKHMDKLIGRAKAVEFPHLESATEALKASGWSKKFEEAVQQQGKNSDQSKKELPPIKALPIVAAPKTGIRVATEEEKKWGLTQTSTQDFGKKVQDMVANGDKDRQKKMEQYQKQMVEIQTQQLTEMRRKEKIEKVEAS